MKTLRVDYQPSAADDLEEIVRYIAAQGSPLTAVRYGRRLKERCDAIGLAANAGTPRDDLAPGLRTVGFERRAVIAYLIQADRVLITNVFHGGQDVEGFYRGPDDLD
jgi:toxin ParE1/3/4